MSDTEDYVDELGEFGKGLETGARIKVDAPGKENKLDKDKLKTTDLIDKTKATAAEKGSEVEDVSNAFHVAPVGGEAEVLYNDEVGIYNDLLLRFEDAGAQSDQIFLVDGDCLVWELCMNEKIDWTHGGNLLHFIYNLEHFIKRLRENARIFKVFFIDFLGNSLWQISSQYALLRELTIHHLQHILHIPVIQFQDTWWSANSSFMQWLRASDPAFILVGDGSVATIPTELEQDFVKHSVAKKNNNVQNYLNDVHSLFRNFTLYLLSHHFRLTRISELQFLHQNIYGFHLGMKSNQYKINLRNEKLSRNEGGYEPPEKFTQKVGSQYEIINCPSYRQQSASSFKADLFNKIAGVKQIQHIDQITTNVANNVTNNSQRVQFITYALIQTLSSVKDKQYGSVSAVDLAKTVLLHEYFLQTLPLTARCVKWDNSDDSIQYDDFLEAFNRALLSIVTAQSASLQLTPALTDLYDGRLISYLLHLFQSNLSSLGWSQAMATSAESVWQFIAAESSVSTALVPVFNIKSLALPDVQALSAEQIAEKEKEFDKLVAEREVATRELLEKKAAALLAIQQKRLEALQLREDSKSKTEDDDADLGSWDDEVSDEKKEEEEALDSWDASSDEDESASAAPAAASSNAAPASAAAASVPLAKSLTVDLKPINKIINSFVHEIAQDTEAVLHYHHLVQDSAPQSLSEIAQSYQLPQGQLISDGIPTEVPQRKTRKEQKAYMQYMNFWEQYSKSLVGGRLVLREVVVAEQPKEEEEEEKEEKDDKKGGKGKGKDDKEKKKSGKPGAGGGKKGAAKTVNIRDKIAQDLEDKAKAEKARKIKGSINIASMQKTLENKIKSLDNALEQVSEPQAIPGLFQLLEWCMDAWKIAKPKNEMGDAVRVFVLIHDIYRRFKDHLTAAEFQKLYTFFFMLGFEEERYKEFQQDFLKTTNNKFTLKEITPVKLNISNLPQTSIGWPYNRFQLEFCGPYMLRNLDSAPDARVSGFYPDKWQRDLLDVVDQGQSALIIAPTSAGKTFVSYYVMKNMLIKNKTIERSKDRGIVVYVSPTKALVSQVSADIYRRYGPVFGMLTDDYADKPLACEVLITVPTMFEALLLNPERESWVKQIKWVIFDEVHSIGAEQGLVWERCLSLLRSPFLALSATVGNPEKFHSWLSRLEEHRNRKVHLICHQTRWSDLEKSEFIPQNPTQASSFEKFADIHAIPVHAGLLHRIHPCAAISDVDFQAQNIEFPSELSFSPKDSVSLYDAMLKILSSLPADLQASLKQLSPEAHFQNVLLINKSMAMEYESKLKKELTHWLSAGLSAEVTKVMNSLSGDLKVKIAQMESQAGADSCYDTDFLRTHFFSLLLELYQSEQMPAIVFCNDPALCVKLVEDTVEKLEALEFQVKSKEVLTDEQKAKLKLKEKQLKELKRKRDAKEKKSTKKHSDDEGYSDDDDDELLALEEEADEYEVDARFSFIAEHERMSAKELEYWVKRTLYKTGWKKTHPLIRALFRGIGVHHGGLVKQYRDLVETLFRGKHLKAVVATSTLALGVNMPARTVALCGDNKLLTPLVYRQMSGRAGRRGFDNVGSVVFFGIPSEKIFRLLKSPLTSLRGHFPIDTTITLRLTQYHEHVKDKKSTAHALAPIVKEPFFKDSYNSSALSQQINFMFRYSLNYLYEKNFIDSRAKGVGFNSLVAHLHSNDPANYGLVALLESGHISNICKNYEEDAIAVAKELLQLLSYLFFRVPMPAHATKQSIKANSQNLIILPPMPEDVKQILQTHNSLTLQSFTNFVRSFARTELSQQPAVGLPAQVDPTVPSLAEGFFQLPVSGLSYNWIYPNSVSQSTPNVMQAIQSGAPSISARSPFVATSGHDDSFTSGRDLSETVRNGMYLDQHLIPVCEDKDYRGRDLQFNAYAIDFYRSQHFYSLQTENKLTNSYSWQLLKNWSLLLRSIWKALQAISKEPETDLIHKSFKFLSETFDQHFILVPT